MRSEKEKGRLFLRIDEVAKFFGLSKFTIYKYIRQGRLKAFRLGKYLYVPKSEIEKLYGEKIEI